MTACPNCRGHAWLRFDQPDGTVSDAPCWVCPAGLSAMGIGSDYYAASVTDSPRHGPALAAWDGCAPGWYLVGTNGAGKTHLAAGICRAQASKGRNPRLLTSARLLKLIKATFDRDTRSAAAAELEPLDEADVLVLDDLGMEQVTDWAESELTCLIDDLSARRAALVVTSNLDHEALAARLGMRLASRVIGLTRAVHVTGGDRRLAKHG